jgi:hypothetical protein
MTQPDADSENIEPGQTWHGRYQTITVTVTVVQPKRIGFVLPYAHGATSYLSRAKFIRAYTRSTR